jgi:hypothetical protein
VFWLRLTCIISAFYFGATLLIFFQSKRAADAATNAANTANQSMQLEQRAWIAPVKAEMLPPDRWKSGGPEFQVQYINTGNQPAMDASELFAMATSQTARVLGESLRASVDSPDICHGRQPARQGRHGLVIFKGADMGVQPTFQFPAIPSGDDTAIFMECVSYKTMGEIHHTAFCYQFNTATHGSVWSICNAGNHAD